MGSAGVPGDGARSVVAPGGTALRLAMNMRRPARWAPESGSSGAEEEREIEKVARESIGEANWATADTILEWKQQAAEIAAQRQQEFELEEAFASRVAAVAASDANSSAAAAPRRMGVCVNGQMARLELESKIEHLFAPNEANFVIDVVLVLAPLQQAVQYRPGISYFRGRKEWTLETIRSTITNRTGLGGGRIIVDDSPQEKHPMLRYEFTAGIPYLHTAAERKSLVANNVRMWGGLWRCYRHFHELERTNGARYDALVRVRDDGWLVSDIKLDAPEFERQWRGSVLVSSCVFFGGLNDRWSVMDAAHGFAYFAAPLVDYYLEGWERVWRISRQLVADGLAGPFPAAGNAEMHLKSVLSLHNATVREVGADTLPIVQSRMVPVEASSELGRSCFPITRGEDMGPALGCVPTSPEVRAMLYCNRCEVESGDAACERMCQCTGAGDNSSQHCSGTATITGDFCMRVSTGALKPIVHRPCDMCVRHRCWPGGKTCASRWSFTDPQGSQRLECECACCRQACGHEEMCDVGSAVRLNRARTETSALPVPATLPARSAGSPRVLSAVVAAAAMVAVVLAVFASSLRRRQVVAPSCR